jgi:osmotically-inducible protein OsmY
MAIRKFLKHAGEKILHLGKGNDQGKQQQQYSATPTGQQQSAGRADAQGSAPPSRDRENAGLILEYIRLQVGDEMPVDVVVMFDEPEGTVILEGTVPDEESREAVVKAAGNIQGVEKVDDRLQTKKGKSWPQ